MGVRLVALGSPLLALAAAACAPRENAVHLVLPPEGSAGLACVDTATGDRLIERSLLPSGGAQLTAVIDFVAFDGVPSCRPNELLSWCETEGCPLRRRRCFELSIDPPLPSGNAELQARLVEELSSLGTLASNTPDGLVVVRMVLTRQPCEELQHRESFRCEDLMGCVHSCAAPLDEVRGDIVLDLDVLARTCTQHVIARCASFGSAEGCGG